MAFIYLLSSKAYGTLYVGSTFDLPRRIYEHKAKAVPGFTAKYDVNRLVGTKPTRRSTGALIRERQIKKWKRDWKINLIERDNPHWLDLSASLAL